jgi:hypothetical protein
MANPLLLLLAVLAAAVAPAGAATDGDAYLAGYAAAVLERELRLDARVEARDGVLTVHVGPLAQEDRARLVSTLGAIAGVREVVVRADAPPGLAAASPPPARALRTGFLPPGVLFAPLHASPRWPHFAATYRYYVDDRELGHVGAADFGETIPLYRGDAPLGGQWEAGIQGGVFAIFDLAAESADLINADYMGGLFATYRRGGSAALLRVLHQSSHLGDEYLLRSRVDRVNLSYELAELTLAQHLFGEALRLYGGGGGLLHREPADIDRWHVHYGVEGVSPWTLVGDHLRPVAFAHVGHADEHGWNADVSLRGGVRVDPWGVGGRQLHVLGEYFDGHSPNGQFFRRRIETVGIGLHLFF